MPFLWFVACAMHAPPADELGWFVASPDPSLSFDRRFGRTDLACPSTPVTVAVHGYFGAGVEWDQAMPSLPGTVYLFRWSPYEPGDEVLTSLVDGLSTLEACGQPLTVIGHSAGGILLSFVVSRLPAPTAPMEVWTVASPLGGTGAKPMNPDSSIPFAQHMGERIDGYPAATAGIHVMHFRTSPKHDPFSATHDGHDPLAVTVPGAVVVDLPDTLGHNTSLPWVAQHLADGTWTAWLPS